MGEPPFFEPYPDPAEEIGEHHDVDVPWAPPSHAIGVVVPLGVDVFRGQDVVIRATHALVYRRGLEVHVSTWVRPGARRPPGRHDWPHQDPRVGVRLADGTRVGHDPRLEGHPADSDLPYLWMLTSGSGGSLRFDQAWWLHPLPAGDHLEVVAAWEPMGVPESAARFELAALRRAADAEEVLWDPPPPPGADGLGWFAYAPLSREAYRSDATIRLDQGADEEPGPERT